MAESCTQEPSYVFGYGSLAGSYRGGLPSARIVHLDGFRRVWNVAMDNRVTLPGYKYYLEPDTGARPELFVTFLNLTRVDGARVNGTLIRVDSHDLAALDRRERNYDRCEVTHRILEPVDGRVWTYLGSAAARRRYEDGVASDSAAIDGEYYEAVKSDFRALGERHLDEFEKTTDAPAVTVVRLRRIDLSAPEIGSRDA